MSSNKLRSYPSEFKESSVKLALGSGKPIIETAKNLGINVNTLHTWIRKYSSPAKKKSDAIPEHHFDEIKRLKKELFSVKQERDLLKKAAAYFARETL